MVNRFPSVVYMYENVPALAVILKLMPFAVVVECCVYENTANWSPTGQEIEILCIIVKNLKASVVFF